MVECESTIRFTGTGNYTVLIDTWWNVNMSDGYPIEHTEWF